MPVNACFYVTPKSCIKEKPILSLFSVYSFSDKFCNSFSKAMFREHREKSLCGLCGLQFLSNKLCAEGGINDTDAGTIALRSCILSRRKT